MSYAVTKTPTTQEIIRELKLLGKKHPLKELGLQRAKILMAALKLRGHTNKQISYSVGGTWSIPTIKLYTRGIAPRRKENEEESLLMILDALINDQLSIEDIRLACKTKQDADEEKVTVEDIAFVIEEARELGMRLQTVLISWYNLKQSGLTTDKIGKLLGIVRLLEENSMTVKELEKIMVACSDPSKKAELLRQVEHPTDSHPANVGVTNEDKN